MQDAGYDLDWSPAANRDELIVQPAKESAVEKLYSEDLSDGQVYDSVLVASPFR